MRRFLGSAARITGRVTLTVAIIAGAGVAIQYGSAELADRAASAPAPEAAAPMSVAATALNPQTHYEIRRAFIGQVEPQRRVEISFELSGQLDQILVDEGDAVSAGDLLATQDTLLLDAERQRLEASRDAIAAQLTFAEQNVERNTGLRGQGLTSQASFDEALARRDELVSRIAETDAALTSVAIRLEKSRIVAPFDGRVTERLVDGGETLGAGQRILGLVETSAPTVRVGVPLDLTEGALSTVEIEAGGKTLPAELLSLRPDIDPVTRTRTALFQLDAQSKVTFGETARLIMSQSVEADGLWVPVTSLKEGVRGQWTVLVVDPEDTVRSASVEILHAESDRVFVRGGFPEGTRLINDGPQRVTVGQRVVVENS
ncbi:MAG: efflux RND transporter periplasmic adaptor subunit [Pseudomonadota bacterium]